MKQRSRKRKDSGRLHEREGTCSSTLKAEERARRLRRGSRVDLPVPLRESKAIRWRWEEKEQPQCGEGDEGDEVHESRRPAESAREQVATSSARYSSASVPEVVVTRPRLDHSPSALLRLLTVLRQVKKVHSS